MQTIAKRMLKEILNEATSLARDVDQVVMHDQKIIHGQTQKNFIMTKVDQILDRHEKLSRFLGIKDEF